MYYLLLLHRATECLKLLLHRATECLSVMLHVIRYHRTRRLSLQDITLRISDAMQELVRDQRRLSPRIATLKVGHGTCIVRTSMCDAILVCVPMQPWFEQNCYTFQLGLQLVHGLSGAISRPIIALQQGPNPLLISVIPAAAYLDNPPHFDVSILYCGAYTHSLCYTEGRRQDVSCLRWQPCSGLCGDQEKYRKQVARINTNERGLFVLCSTNYFYIVQLRIGALCQTSLRMMKALIRYRTHGNCSREAMLTYTSHLNLQQCCRACMCMFFISAPPKIVSWEAGALSLLQS